MRLQFYRFLFSSCLALTSVIACNAASVWRIIDGKGNLVYVGGSVHGLSSTDYPLPPAYNLAFDASSRLVLEEPADVSPNTLERYFKSGFYPRNDSLKNHIDPRTYDYLRRLFAIWSIPEVQLQRFRPWMLTTLLWGSATNPLGVEAFLIRRARANGKPIDGLESYREHLEFFSGLTDKQAELVLLETFIPQAPGTDARSKLLSAWRRGDVDAVAQLDQGFLPDLPSFKDRILYRRNRNWIPKIEGYLRSGKVYFVVAGVGHMGGPSGVLALLRQRGYHIEQL